jgi:hypothetical protein
LLHELLDQIDFTAGRWCCPAKEKHSRPLGRRACHLRRSVNPGRHLQTALQQDPIPRAADVRRRTRRLPWRRPRNRARLRRHDRRRQRPARITVRSHWRRSRQRRPPSSGSSIRRTSRSGTHLYRQTAEWHRGHGVGSSQPSGAGGRAARRDAGRRQTGLPRARHRRSGCRSGSRIASPDAALSFDACSPRRLTLGEATRTADYTEGITAFQTKHEPSFTGRPATVRSQ